MSNSMDERRKERRTEEEGILKQKTEARKANKILYV